jgi:hypothetical protein
MENFEQYLKIAKSITISTEDYIRFMDLVEEEAERVKQFNLGRPNRTVVTYRVNEMNYRGFVSEGNDWVKGEHRIPNFQLATVSDLEWWNIVDKLDGNG